MDKFKDVQIKRPFGQLFVLPVVWIRPGGRWQVGIINSSAKTSTTNIDVQLSTCIIIGMSLEFKRRI